MMMLSSSYRTKFWFSRGKVRLLQLLRSEADYRHYLLKTFQSIPAVFFLVLSKLIWTGLTHVVSVASLNCLVKLGFANVWNQHHVIKRCLSIQNASLQRFHLYVQISRNPQTTLIFKIEKYISLHSKACKLMFLVWATDVLMSFLLHHRIPICAEMWM